MDDFIYKTSARLAVYIISAPNGPLRNLKDSFLNAQKRTQQPKNKMQHFACDEYIYIYTHQFK